MANCIPTTSYHHSEAVPAFRATPVAIRLVAVMRTLADLPNISGSLASGDPGVKPDASDLILAPAA